MSSKSVVGCIAIASGAIGVLVGQYISKKPKKEQLKYSDGDQVARFEHQKATNDKRALDIDAFYKGSQFVGKRVLITGANRGIGLALVQQLADDGAIITAVCRQTSKELSAVKGNITIIEDVEVTDVEKIQTMSFMISTPQDIVINNAGYFPNIDDTLATPNYEEQLKQIDICALGCLRVTAELINNNKIVQRGKIVLITSQAGSIQWRDIQNPDGGNYGHHMSRAATNIMGKLLANEVKGQYSVSLLHPGFNRTDMTKKYQEIWDREGAVDVTIGAKRVLYEVSKQSLETSGNFINCEDGLIIPW